MTPTATQIRDAARNYRRLGRTRCARIRDALVYVQKSQNEKTGWRAGSLESSRRMNATEVTLE